MDMLVFPTTTELPGAADRVVQEFIAEIFEVSADLVRGIYITGSIPLNDFHPTKSDIDFLILCNELPEGAARLKLELLHTKIERNIKKPNLSGFYITKDAFNVQNAPTTKTLYFNEGRMSASTFDMAPVTLYELKTTAITVWGIPANELPIRIDLQDTRTFLLENINSYWKNWVAKHSSITKRLLLLILFPRLSEWVILGLARQLYTLKTGLIASKTAAGYYCLKHLPERYRDIIQQAIEIRNGESWHVLTLKSSYYIRPSVKRASETIACANYIIRFFNEEYERQKNGH